MKELEYEVFKKNKDIVARVIDDETVLVPLIKTEDDIKAIYTLDNIANSIWELFDGKRSIKEIRQILLKKYDVEEKRLDKDIAKFVQELKEIKAII